MMSTDRRSAILRSMIPLLHDFTDETALVVGGGPVGARKAHRFAREATVVVSISTGGTAPALSTSLRQELEEPLAGVDDMAAVCDELRSKLKSQDVASERRHEIVTDVVNSPDVWTALRSGDSNTHQVIEDVLGDELPPSGGERA